MARAMKTEAELRYIIKDAYEAAQAMRDHDPVAEAKYLDQMNDAATELYIRRQKLFSRESKTERRDCYNCGGDGYRQEGGPCPACRGTRKISVKTGS